MTTFLGFFINRTSRDEFVAPAEAADLGTARIEFTKAYPESRYQLLTIYSRPEIEHILGSIQRWPGLPSKVQEPLDAKLAKVTARTGGLPPLPGQKTTIEATVQPVETISQQAMPGWMQSYVASTMAKPQAAAPATALTKAQPAPQSPMQPMMQAMAQTHAATPQTVAQPQTLIERLKAARGETTTRPAPREALPQPMPAATIARGNSSASVIDILKSMRK